MLQHRFPTGSFEPSAARRNSRNMRKEVEVEVKLKIEDLRKSSYSQTKWANYINYIRFYVLALSYIDCLPRTVTVLFIACGNSLYWALLANFEWSVEL